VCAGCFGPVVLPRAVFTWVFESDFTVRFDGSTSDGGESTLISWEWDFGDGASATGPHATHTYASPGDYLVELTVEDARGFRAATRETIRAARELLVPQEYWTIQEAIDDAGPGDTVVVSPDRYPENIRFRGVDITVRSTDPSDPDIVAATIIEPGSSGGGLRTGPVVTFDDGESTDCILEGFTIRGLETAGAQSGNGIFVRSSSPTIRGNVLRDHLSGTSGAAIYLIDSSAAIVDNRFLDNSCDPLRVGAPGSTVAPGWDSVGGAIEVRVTHNAPAIVNNEFKRNSAIAGGAIHIGLGAMGSGSAVASVEIRGNDFVSNRATGEYSPISKTTDVGGAIQAAYESLIDWGVRDTNTYVTNLPEGHDVYYEFE